MTSQFKEKIVIDTSLNHPDLGYKKIHHIVRQWLRVKINKKAVYRILKENDLLKDRVKKAAEIKKKYKLKLSELKPNGINEVWQMDITYVFVEGHGFQFHIDIQDYFSKYVLAGRLSHTYTAAEAIKAIRDAVSEAVRLTGAPLTKQIHLITDNGTTFIAKFFAAELGKLFQDDKKTKKLFEHIRVGYRMPQHIGSIERFHGNLKRECVYQHWFEDPLEAAEACRNYVVYHNFLRPHWTHKLKTPAEVYLKKEFHQTLDLMPCRTKKGVCIQENTYQPIEINPCLNLIENIPLA